MGCLTQGEHHFIVAGFFYLGKLQELFQLVPRILARCSSHFIGKLLLSSACYCCPLRRSVEHACDYSSVQLPMLPDVALDIVLSTLVAKLSFRGLTCSPENLVLRAPCEVSSYSSWAGLRTGDT